jgi:hypothetical protein
MTQSITSGQMRRLQTLYGQFAAHAIEGNDREARLAWASEQTGRAVASFGDLTGEEAHRLIDGLQGQMQMKFPAQAVRKGAKHHRLDRDAAHRAGTEGRRGNESKEMTMAGAAEFARIQYVLDLIGWNQAQLDAWLSSARSPLGRRAHPSIRTLGDANRVWWALKRMAKTRGLWKEKVA